MESAPLSPPPLNAKTEAMHETSLRFLAQPSSVNFGGKVHGGIVMKWIDEAGYVCAMKWAGRYCVTAYVSGISFLRPIQVGQLVEVQARLAMTGRTSMHVLVDVTAGDVKALQRLPTTRCLIVFVAVDDEGRPVEVPTWAPNTAEGVELRDYAERAKVLRAELHLTGPV